MTREKKEKTKRKGRKSPLESVSLNTNEAHIGDTFLGVRRTPGTYNQLWRWDSLEDVVFK